MHKNLALFIIDGFCYDLEKNIICFVYQVAKRTNLFTGLVWSLLISSLDLLLTCRSWLQFWNLNLGHDTNRIWYILVLCTSILSYWILLPKGFFCQDIPFVTILLCLTFLLLFLSCIWLYTLFTELELNWQCNQVGVTLSNTNQLGNLGYTRHGCLKIVLSFLCHGRLQSKTCQIFC